MQHEDTKAVSVNALNKICLRVLRVAFSRLRDGAGGIAATCGGHAAGRWAGRGSTTVGDVNSETGRLRISWQTTNEEPAGRGHFKLTLRSGVSGRTIAVVTDHKGVGSGTLETDEGPRTYDFLVDSANLDWSFRVEETTGEYGTGEGRPAPENRKF
jgi:hypothetical protein